MQGDLESKQHAFPPQLPQLTQDQVLATATFVWMLQCISPHLTIDQDAFRSSMVQYQRWLDRIRYSCTYHHENWKDWIKNKIPNIPLINPADDELTPPKRDPPHSHSEFDYGWGTGHIVDSYGGLYKLAGAVPRVPGHCQAEIYDPAKEEFRLVDIDKYGETHEYIHPICAYRNMVRGFEANSALRDFERKFEEKNGKGRYWWYHKTDNKPMPEWIILRDGDAGTAAGINFERSWYGQCERNQKTIEALQVAGVKKDWLMEVDEKVDFGVGGHNAWEYP